MLPPAAYAGQAVFEWERWHFFGGAWTCVARSDQVPGPGDLRAEDSGDGGLLLARGADGVVRAFANVCRHRGHELLPCGSAARAKKAIVCPYHSWSFGLEGELLGAPGYRGETGFDPARWSLIELPAAEWHGLIFADGSRGAAGPLPLAELCRISSPASGANWAATGAWIGGWMELRPGADSMSFDGSSAGVPLRGLSAGQRRTVIYVSVFPNVLLSLHPDYVMTHLLRPLGPDSTRIECSWAFAPEALARPGFDPAPRSASGTWSTARTGPPVSRSSAGCPPRTPSPARWRPVRTRSITS